MPHSTPLLPIIPIAPHNCPFLPTGFTIAVNMYFFPCITPCSPSRMILPMLPICLTCTKESCVIVCYMYAFLQMLISSYQYTRMMNLSMLLLDDAGNFNNADKTSY